jgi:alkanesulfonate monooxygenase SsuD/methylene tetrahydromethanopterin reductase-like flavin-dependent oxidoreductase (luciferase family)
VRRAARIADAWCIAPTLSTRSILSASRLFATSGARPASRKTSALPLIRESLCRSRRRAYRATSRRPLLFKYRAYASWGQGETRSDFDAAFDDFARDRFLIGEAEQVKDEMLRYAEIARTDPYPAAHAMAGLEHREPSGTSSGSAGSSQPSAELGQEEIKRRPETWVALMSALHWIPGPTDQDLSRSGSPE